MTDAQRTALLCLLIGHEGNPCRRPGCMSGTPPSTHAAQVAQQQHQRCGPGRRADRMSCWSRCVVAFGLGATVASAWYALGERLAMHFIAA